MKKFTAILIGFIVILIAVALNADEENNKDTKDSSKSFQIRQVKRKNRVRVYEDAAPFISACNWSKNTVDVEMEWDNNSSTLKNSILALEGQKSFIPVVPAEWSDCRIRGFRTEL